MFVPTAVIANENERCKDNFLNVKYFTALRFKCFKSISFESLLLKNHYSNIIKGRKTWMEF